MFRRVASAGLVCTLLAGCAAFDGAGDVPHYKNAVFADRWHTSPETGRIADIDYFLWPRDEASGHVTLVEVLRRTERETGRVQWTTGACRGAGQVFRRLLNFQYEMTASRQAGGTLAQELQEEFRAHFDRTLAPCWRDEAPF